MIRTAIIMAAGRGTRMGQHSEYTPKPLTLINNVPFVWYQLSRLVDCGMTRIILVVGHLADSFNDIQQRFAGRYPAVSLELVNQFTTVPNKMGTGVSLQAAHSVVTESAVVMNGDNLYAVEDIAACQQLTDGRAYIAVKQLGPQQQYGAVILSAENNLIHIQHKDDPIQALPPGKQYNNAGLYVCTQQVYDAVVQVPQSPSGEYRITDALLAVKATIGVGGYILQGEWNDLSTSADIQRLEQEIL